MLNTMITWLVETIGSLGYPGIVMLMALESSFFPFPSEVVMIPAGYLASKGEMNLVFAILFGVLGSLLGALFNYYLAIKLGRPALVKWGKHFFIPEDKLIKAETSFKKHGEISTFVGRLIPVLRQYISFPAGLSRMSIAKFSAWTSIGAGIWMAILAAIGYCVGENEELVAQWSHKAIFWMLAICIGIVLVYLKIHKSN
ncbi:DedA family protein [Candidatus Peribacteria bacterium]|nr:DedA family protein [Candidatus Peribacteria bacterium]MBT4021282.1 DedA family protein [Candidatus Peribacteria bacterium]MBT4240345.1 DedA family protein [Candidatus Peribacteria bacterium]MBT4474058.1 DedA family protein [Candidatus Peribacteria bacterium]